MATTPTYGWTTPDSTSANNVPGDMYTLATGVEATLISTAAGLARPPIAANRITNTGNPIGTTTSATELDMTKYALTGLSLTTGRYYLFRAMVTVSKSVATDSVDFYIRANTALTGTMLGLYSYFANEPSTITRMLEFLFIGSNTYTSLYLSAKRTAGTGTLVYYGASTGFNRCFSELLDRGQSTWIDTA